MVGGDPALSVCLVYFSFTNGSISQSPHYIYDAAVKHSNSAGRKLEPVAFTHRE